MSSQDGNPLSDASSTRRILTPPAEPSQIPSDGALSGSRKRKRDGNTMEDLLRDSFVVKPYPSKVIVKTRKLEPLLLLPRSRLALSSLDTTPFSSGLPPSRLFESHVKILELEERMGSQPVVLIARLDDGRSLYAVEREARGLYVLLHLGSWVDLHQLRAVAVVSKQDVSRTLDRRSGPGATLPAAPLTIPESSKYSKKKRLAIEAIQSMVKRPSMSLSANATPTETRAVIAPEEPAKGSHPQEKLDTSLNLGDAAQPTANEIFENVRTQYFEALYLSKASLAYFAKGPLSRARAAFHLDYDSTLDMTEHITFLESLIMSTTIIDKKYRDGVPGCVASIGILDQSADEANPDAERTRKRRTNKKMKPRKNGLYPAEDLLIRRWWASHDDEADLGAPGTSREDLAKTRISQLRIRETQLQMIIILEVLALQPLAPVSEETDTSLPATLPQGVNGGGKQKTAKTKTVEHLSMLIDVHIDRLCIWQSIVLEAVKAPTDGVASQSESPGVSSTSVNADNILRDFCVEVILPFFAARLPDRCATINRKLGGPVVASPPKPKLPKAASTSNVISRPGAATKRPVPAKPRRSLQRILTDERERRSVSSGSGRPISLMRSATMPAVPGLKREGSEAPSLGSIPFADAQSVQASRGGVLNSKRFSRREVDMSSLAPKVIARKRAQVDIEAELKEAISALKKPNRELAGKALAETAEKRSASAPNARKSKKPVQNPLFHGVQITATPKADRRKDIFTEKPTNSVPQAAEDADWGVIPPSSLPRIPQSVTRPSTDDRTKNPLFSVQATPTRKPTANQVKGRNGFLDVATIEGGCQPLSPLQLGRSGSQLFNLGPETSGPQSSWSSQGEQETPAKPKSEAMLVHSHPILSTPVYGKENMGSRGGMSDGLKRAIGKTQEDSIYTALGWDDPDDIDDLA